jgi:hypothetical protein
VITLASSTNLIQVYQFGFICNTIAITVATEQCSGLQQ